MNDPFCFYKLGIIQVACLELYKTPMMEPKTPL